MLQLLELAVHKGVHRQQAVCSAQEAVVLHPKRCKCAQVDAP